MNNDINEYAADGKALEHLINNDINEYAADAKVAGLRPNRLLDGLIAWNMAWCELLVLAMMLTIAIDVFTRATLNFSWQMSEEIAGYLLVALSFSSLAGGMRDGAFLRVDFLFVRFSPQTRRRLDGIYAILGLLFVGVWTWQLGRLVLSSYAREMVSNSAYPVPLWIPQLVMPFGAGLLFIMLGRVVWAWFSACSFDDQGEQA